MKKHIPLLLAALLLTGCVAQSGQDAAASPETIPIAPQTEAAAEAPPAQSAEGGSWALDLLEGLFGYDEPIETVPVPEPPPNQWQDERQEAPAEENLTELYTLTVDDTGLVTRTEGVYEHNLTWVIECNDRIELERNAENEMTYRPMDYGSGTYRVWLKAYVQGYQQVSNTVEFTRPSANQNQQNHTDDWTQSIIMTKKGHMKHLVQRIVGYGMPEYKLGFVIDPDHDGYYNGVVFCAGTGDDGELVQYVYDNDSSSIHFGTELYAEDGIECTLGIWCDAANGRDYIVRIESDGTAYDCCTEEIIPDFAEDINFFTFTDADPSDRDHFYVSYDGIPEWEGA